jgi:hypothetical protein
VTEAEGKVGEVWGEFRAVFAGRGNLIDSVLPTVVFVVVNALAGFVYAVWSALALAAVFAIWRLMRRQPVRYAPGGVAAVALATAIALLLDRAEGYFLPAIVTGLATALACVISVVVRRPLVAWTSHFVRRWPRGWYWHPQVRPAYSHVTLAWAVFFGLRVWLQLALLGRAQGTALGAVNLAAGWPATIVLLIGSYLYGTWRLRTLGGPSVAEFEEGAKPPWHGQRRGF